MNIEHIVLCWILYSLGLTLFYRLIYNCEHYRMSVLDKISLFLWPAMLLFAPIFIFLDLCD